LTAGPYLPKASLKVPVKTFWTEPAVKDKNKKGFKL
jgi:hypothetical protein